MFSVFGFEGTFLDSSMVEHSAVNRRVAGSSPARGASVKPRLIKYRSALFGREILCKEL